MPGEYPDCQRGIWGTEIVRAVNRCENRALSRAAGLAGGIRARRGGPGYHKEWDRTGLRRTNDDKRRPVVMAIRARPKLSDRKIAEQVGVTDKTVKATRLIFGSSEDTTRTVTRNGVTYEMNVGGIGRLSVISVRTGKTDGRGVASHWRWTHVL